MRRLRFLSLALCALATASWGAPFSHAPFDQVLQTYVDSLGRVDYAALKTGRAALDAYIDSLARYSPHNHPERFPGREYELAYWINAYNAFVLRGIVEFYPVDSVMHIEVPQGFFHWPHFVAGGEKLSLDEIENKIIRPAYQDPRIHAAINCGAASCPRLENRAFTAADLQERLDAAMRRFARRPYMRLDREHNKLYLSRILQWYGDDFVKWYPGKTAHPPTLIDYLLLYLPAAEASYLHRHRELEIVFADYDWSLNRRP